MFHKIMLNLVYFKWIHGVISSHEDSRFRWKVARRLWVGLGVVMCERRNLVLVFLAVVLFRATSVTLF